MSDLEMERINELLEEIDTLGAKLAAAEARVKELEELKFGLAKQHELHGAAAERAAVVAWLRTERSRRQFGIEGSWVAASIEQGDHLTERSTDRGER